MRNLNTISTLAAWRMPLYLLLFLMLGFSQVVSAQKAVVLDRNGLEVQGALASTGQSVAVQDSLALVAIYMSTNGDRWVNNDGWLTEMVEFWHGVARIQEIQVGEDVFEWRVTRFEMQGNEMTGEIPPEIELLDQVERFILLRNNLVGPIPEEIGGMKRMHTMRFGDNYLSGVPPWEALVSLPNLRELQMRVNQLTGDFPPIVADFPSLVQFQVWTNPFTGTIPNEFANITTLERFQIGPSLLSGPMPDFSNMENLTHFFVRRSPLMDPGPFPEFLRGMAERLVEINIKGTNRHGPLPAWLNELFMLEQLIVGEDNLDGEIPDLTFLENLSRLTIRPANMSGPIPDWLGLMPNLEKLQLYDNEFTGQIPQTLANAPSIRRFRLKDLKLDGPLPDLRNLELRRLELANLGFDLGPFPDWITMIAGLDQLYLNDSGLEGPVPNALEFLPLNYLDLSDNPGLTGGLPDGLLQGRMTAMDRLWVSNNTGMDFYGEDISYFEFLVDNYPSMRRIGLDGLGLTGSIPDWFTDFYRLQELNLSDNALTGEIPSILGDMSVVRNFNISNNQLSGEIPPGFAKIGSIGGTTIMSSLRINGNPDLTGPIPMEFMNWNPNELSLFWFHDTGLCEPDDDGFRNWLHTIQASELEPYVVVDGDTLPRVRSTGVICGVASAIDVEVADRMTLHQNYPNPFNPVTTIRYSLPSEAHVNLVVYDVLGRQVATLVGETMHAGAHEVHFDAARLSSGTYIYRLEAGGHSLNQSMMLVK